MKQSCVLVPVFFNYVLYHAVSELDQGVCIRYRLDRSVFDFRHLSAKIKTVEKLILEALFAEDCVLIAHKESDLQLIINKSAESSRLTFSLGNTEVLVQSAPDSTAPPPLVSIEGTELKSMEYFKYLDSVISSDGTLDKEINDTICKASQALGRLCSRVLNQRNIRQSTNPKACNAVNLSSLLYGS